jgi:mono/diheme cytochrome c family protein
MHTLVKYLPVLTFAAFINFSSTGMAAEGAATARDEKVVAVEKEVGSPILQVAQNAAGLVFNVVNVADKFDDGMLAKFAPIADKLEDLNLSRSKITDAGAAQFAAMKNLVRLRVDGTSLTDAALDSLLALPKLEYLNLYNTKVTDAGIAKLEKIASLKNLYAWQTGATKGGAEALHAKLPSLVINLGWDNVVGAPAPAAAVAMEKKPAAAASGDPVDPKKANPEDTVYVGLIQPIFNRTCVACHGEEKKKGKLQMHNFEAVMKNGDSGDAVIVPGKHGDSLAVKRILLPHDNDEHMPPEGKTQVNEVELAVLKWWIDAGAKIDVKIKDAALPADLLK